MAERIKQSVTPSGVKFAVRNLIGADQDLLSEGKNTAEKSSFNEMLHSTLRLLGDKHQSSITLKDVENLLSIDRKFILITLRQHTLNYQEKFSFVYEWPISEGQNNKEKFSYEIKFNNDNFPVIPPYWMRDFIEAEKAKAEEKKEEYKKPDGHDVLFPVLFNTYAEMLAQYSVFQGTFPETGEKYKWSFLNGATEMRWSEAVRSKPRVNMAIEMRNPLISYMDDKWTMFETQRADILLLEHLRGEIKDKEGDVDTFLAIRHPNDMKRETRVDLVGLPVFFFPSQAL